MNTDDPDFDFDPEELRSDEDVDGNLDALAARLYAVYDRCGVLIGRLGALKIPALPGVPGRRHRTPTAAGVYFHLVRLGQRLRIRGVGAIAYAGPLGSGLLLQGPLRHVNSAYCWLLDDRGTLLDSATFEYADDQWFYRPEPSVDATVGGRDIAAFVVLGGHNFHLWRSHRVKAISR